MLVVLGTCDKLDVDWGVTCVTGYMVVGHHWSRNPPSGITG